MSLGRVAVIGASGFVGNRIVEMLHLRGDQVVPIVRRASGLALASRFGITGRVADASDQTALTAALEGCDAAVVCLAGDTATIVDSVEPIYRAADAAGVRRLVHLSSASVHGQAPLPGTDERSPLSDRQRIAYNNAKVRAEWRLQECRRRGSTETVVLRPSIVHGPRSQWTGGFADTVLDGTAALVDGGHGICNAIYVDNLVDAVLLAATVPGVDGETFLVGDPEEVTWRDLARPICTALGVDLDDLPAPPASAAVAPSRQLSELRPVHWVRGRLPSWLRAALRAARDERRGSPGADARHVEVALEQALLHTCRWRLPSERAYAALGWRPAVPFEEACRRSVAWLRFAGYPVIAEVAG